MITISYPLLYKMVINDNHVISSTLHNNKKNTISSTIQFIKRWLPHDIHYHLWKQLDYHTISSTIQLNFKWLSYDILYYPIFLSIDYNINKIYTYKCPMSTFFHKWKNNRTSLLTDSWHFLLWIFADQRNVKFP